MSQGASDGPGGDGPGSMGEKAAGERAPGEKDEDVLASIRRIVGEEDAADASPAEPAARRPGGNAPGVGASEAAAPASQAERRDGVLPLARAMRVEPGRGVGSGDDEDEDAPLVLSAEMRADGGPSPSSRAASPPPAGPDAPTAAWSDPDAPAAVSQPAASLRREGART
ncbi:MAG: hypothetical protein AAF676_15465, partial [Pseudomonadota bacterium]